MKIALCALLVALIGVLLIFSGAVLTPQPEQHRRLVIIGLVLIIVGCFGVILAWPDPPGMVKCPTHFKKLV